MNGHEPVRDAMRAGGMTHKRRIILGGEGTKGRSAIETEETAKMTEEGFLEISATKLHSCRGCYRTIRRLEELGGTCVICQKLLCTDCAQLRCTSKRCRKCVCAEDQIELGEQTYCRKHGIRIIVIRLAVFFVTMGAVALIVYMS